MNIMWKLPFTTNKKVIRKNVIKLKTYNVLVKYKGENYGSLR